MKINRFNSRIFLTVSVTLILVLWAGLLSYYTIADLEDATDTATPQIRFGVWENSRVLSLVIITLCSLLVILVYLLYSESVYHKQHKKERESQQSKIAELSRVKELFLSNMNHEIRTPLNTILGFTSLLQKTELNKEQKQYLHGVHKSSEHLLHMVNDILDYSRLEAGKMPIHSTSFFLPTLVDAVIQSLRPEAELKKLGLFVQVSAELSEQELLSDPARIQQILHHLVGNAIKFTSFGEIHIRCSSIALDPESLCLQILVQDTGIGIPPEQLEHLFDGFQQADTGDTRIYGGTGLGLAICLRLTTLLNGSLHAVSKPGKGSEFTLSIPCRVKKARPEVLPAVQLSLPPEKRSERKKVLIADDDELNRLLLRTLLDSPHIQIEEAENGMKALELATAKRFDLILTDVHMPELSGLGLVREIRSFPDPVLSTTPVIAITANVQNGDPHQYQEAGMNNFLLKPYKESALLELIHKYLSDNLDETPEKYSAFNTKPGASAYNITELHQVSQGNKPFLTKMLRTFIDTTRIHALLLEEECQRGNWERLGGIAHRMSPSCHKFKLHELHFLLLETEHKALHIKDYRSLPALVQQIQELCSTLLPHLETEHDKINAYSEKNEV
ncbi:MAG TPA: ATP-binding protein [Bacteroidia bacterium]|jgi:signal transduction histidine kinase/CheY-like chemotaxis protein|nr:ATP-binding protein [Bacteroidia bacterium]